MSEPMMPQRPTILWMALYLMLMAGIHSVSATDTPPGGGGGGGCLEPWHEQCYASTAGCIDCNAYCTNRGCTVEASDCEEDAQYCSSPSKPVYQECACQ